MRNIKIKGYKRVTKTTARRLYNDGKEIYLIPCNANTACFRNRLIKIIGGDFDNQVNAFEYYNCNNAMGRYASYYAGKVR